MHTPTRTGSTLIDVLVALTVVGVSSASLLPLLLHAHRMVTRSADLRHAAALVQHARGLVASEPCTVSGGMARQGRSEAVWTVTRHGAIVTGTVSVVLSGAPNDAAQPFTVPLAGVCAP